MQDDDLSAVPTTASPAESSGVEAALPPEPTFLFDHLHKTGGTSMRAVFERLFGSESVSPTLDGRRVDWALRRYASYRVVIGHFLPSPVSMAVDRQRLTIVRHPIDRIVSYYDYLRHDVSLADGGRPAVAARSHDLAGFLRLCEEEGNRQVGNFMARHFAMQISRDVLDDRQCLDLACEGLASYDFVGLTERLAESVDQFCYAYSLPAVDDVPRLNASSRRRRGEDLDRSTLDELMERNQVDLALYEFAEGLFAVRQRAMLHDCLLIKADHRLQGSTQRVESDAGTALTAHRVGSARRVAENFGDRAVEIESVSAVGVRSGTNSVAAGEEIMIFVAMVAHIDVSPLTVGIEIRDSGGLTAYGTNTHLLGFGGSVVAGQRCEVCFRFPVNLDLDRYTVTIALHTGADHMERCFHWWDAAASFDVMHYGASPFVGYSRLPVKVRWLPRRRLAGGLDRAGTTRTGTSLATQRQSVNPSGTSRDTASSVTSPDGR